jgi:hypothetical protein
MATFMRGDYHHRHLYWRRGEPAMRSQETVEVRFVSSHSEDWRAPWTCKVQQRREKRRRAVHGLQDGLLPSFSIFSQGEK